MYYKVNFYRRFLSIFNNFAFIYKIRFYNPMCRELEKRSYLTHFEFSECREVGYDPQFSIVNNSFVCQLSYNLVICIEKKVFCEAEKIF